MSLNKSQGLISLYKGDKDIKAVAYVTAGPQSKEKTPDRHTVGLRSPVERRNERQLSSSSEPSLTSSARHRSQGDLSPRRQLQLLAKWGKINQYAVKLLKLCPPPSFSSLVTNLLIQMYEVSSGRNGEFF